MRFFLLLLNSRRLVSFRVVLLSLMGRHIFQLCFRAGALWLWVILLRVGHWLFLMGNTRRRMLKTTLKVLIVLSLRWVFFTVSQSVTLKLLLLKFRSAVGHFKVDDLLFAARRCLPTKLLVLTRHYIIELHCGLFSLLELFLECGRRWSLQWVLEHVAWRLLLVMPLFDFLCCHLECVLWLLLLWGEQDLGIVTPPGRVDLRVQTTRSIRILLSLLVLSLICDLVTSFTHCSLPTSCLSTISLLHKCRLRWLPPCIRCFIPTEMGFVVRMFVESCGGFRSSWLGCVDVRPLWVLTIVTVWHHASCVYFRWWSWWDALLHLNTAPCRLTTSSIAYRLRIDPR